MITTEANHPDKVNDMNRTDVIYPAIIAVFTLAVSLLATTGCGEKIPGEIRAVSIAEADSIITANRENPDFVILDTRTVDEFSRAHIDGAEVIDPHADTFEAELAKLDKNKVYLVYCSDEARSIETVTVMEEEGFSTVYRMQEGIILWAVRGYPVYRPSMGGVYSEPTVPGEAESPE